MNPNASQPAVNVPTVSLIPVTPWTTPEVIADLLEAGSLGAQNVRDGGNLNAFIDACEDVLTSADAQGITLPLGGHNVLTWFRDNDRDPNPISPGAVGAPLGDRLYCETDKGLFFATWFGAWYLIPFQETISDRKCDYPEFSGCLDAEIATGIRPGALPGGMYWRPAANPDMEPAGEIFGEFDDPLAQENGNGTSSTKPELSTPLVLALAGVAALFFLD
mgnify:CR=1 FL=1